MNSKIELIAVCKGYSDFLEITLPSNKKHFDNTTIVTSADDADTQNLCKKYNVNFVIYDGFYKNNAKFNFGGARGFGLRNLKFKDWVVFLDSDIVMPGNFRELLDIDNADINKFYGSYRRFIPTYKDYHDLINKVKDKEAFKAIEGSGCGFFQCVNLNSDVARYYGVGTLYKDSYSASQTDIDFLKLWCPRPDPENHPRLVKTNIEFLHLGVSDGKNHEGIADQETFFNKFIKK